MLAPAISILSGCAFLNALKKATNEIVVDLPKIETVSSVKINLRGRTTKTLYPTLSNNSVKNPVFLYSSSNTNVATVSSNGEIHGLQKGSCDIKIVLESNYAVNTTVKVSVVDEDINHYDYTIMFYLCGSDLENDLDAEEGENYHFISDDIREILSVSEIPDEVKIIFETGGTTEWALESKYLEGATKISSTNLQRWELNNDTNKLKLIETLPTNHMSTENSFSEFLSWGLDDYEADQMGVVISGHGGGIAGCAYDDNYTAKVGNQYWQHTLRTFEVANAAKTALSNSNKEKFTWIGYDCCLMQCADIASVNADYFDYMVASQENEIATGWNHHLYLPSLLANTKITPAEFLPKICDSFFFDKHRETESGKEICYQTLSVLDLSKAESLVTSFNNMCDELLLTPLPYTTAENAFKSPSTLNDFGESIFGLADFSSFLTELEKRRSTLDTEAVQDAIDDLVMYKANCSKYNTEPCGVNMFFPLSLDKDYILQVGREDYSHSLSTKFTTWQNMCITNGSFGWESI